VHAGCLSSRPPGLAGLVSAVDLRQPLDAAASPYDGVVITRFHVTVADGDVDDLAEPYPGTFDAATQLDHGRRASSRAMGRETLIA
jgi:hypothetical protein